MAAVDSDAVKTRENLDLVGSKVAAEILGVAGPHVSRLRKTGRLPSVPVEGTVPVYRRSDVQALAREIKARRRRKGT